LRSNKNNYTTINRRISYSILGSAYDYLSRQETNVNEHAISRTSTMQKAPVDCTRSEVIAEQISWVGQRSGSVTGSVEESVTEKSLTSANDNLPKIE